MADPFIVYENNNNIIQMYGRATVLPNVPAGQTAIKVSEQTYTAFVEFLENGNKMLNHADPGADYIEAVWTGLPYPAAISVEDKTQPDLTTAERAAIARDERNDLLLKTDWTQLPDVALSAASVNNFATYRQALRDVPEQSGFPGTINWPSRPAEVND